MPTVLRILARMNVGGPARHVLRIAAPLRAAGWNSVLVTGQPEAGEGDLVERARSQGQEVVVVPALGRAIRPLADRRALAALAELIRQRQPAVVHTHTAKAGVLGRLAANAVHPRPALVHTFHGHVLSGYFPRPVSWLAARLEARLARRTDRLVAVSAAVRDELVGVHGVGAAEQYTLIPPGFDVDRVRPDKKAGARLRARLGWSPDHCVVGVVGRQAPVKNVEALLDVWPDVLATGGHARLLVVGDGPSGESIRDRVAGLPGATALGWQADLKAVYGALDLFALPSRREGLPQAVVEALSAGVPVVASAVGGVPELVRDGIDGVLVAPGDGAALLGALTALIADDARRAAFGVAAARRTWDAHTAAAVAGALAAVYAEVTDAGTDAAGGDGTDTVAQDGTDPRLSGGVSSRHAAGPCTSSS